MEELLLLLNVQHEHDTVCAPQLLIYSNMMNEEDMFIINMLLAYYDNRRKRHSRPPKFYESWIDKYLAYDFFLLFRMSRETFSSLLEEIDGEEFHKPYTGGEQQVEVEKQLLMTLWWLGKGEVLLSVADKFNVAVSTVYICTEMVISKLLVLQNVYMKWPDIHEAIKIESDFRDKAGYPDVIGAIDVCNIPFKAPVAVQENYVDRKLQHSIKLQGIATCDKIFTNIMAGFPGSVHDSRVLANSNIYREVQEQGQYQKSFFFQ